MSTLEATLKEVIGETTKPQEAQIKETRPELNESADTNSGEPASKEYVGGVDISDVPEQDRPRIKELLSKKISLVEKGAQEKFKEISKYKKEKDELLNAGLTEDEASGVLRQYLENKKNNNTQTKSETLRTLDKMIKDAPYEQRESLSNLRQIIFEETGAQELRREVEDLKKMLGIVNNERVNSKVQSINNSLNALTDQYGKEFIDKYRDEIIKQGVAYPDAPVKRLITAIADPDDIEQAILSRVTKKEKTNIDKKLAAISSPNSGMVSSADSIDVRKESHKSLLGKLLAMK